MRDLVGWQGSIPLLWLRCERPGRLIEFHIFVMAEMWETWCRLTGFHCIAFIWQGLSDLWWLQTIEDKERKGADWAYWYVALVFGNIWKVHAAIQPLHRWNLIQQTYCSCRGMCVYTDQYRSHINTLRIVYSHFSHTDLCVNMTNNGNTTAGTEKICVCVHVRECAHTHTHTHTHILVDQSTIQLMNYQGIWKTALRQTFRPLV